MKKMFISLFFTVLLLLSLTATMIAGVPDTVRISAYPSTWPTGSLDDVINSDTIAGGYVKPNTVFLLQQTGSLDTVYYMTAPLTVKGSVKIIGRANPVTSHPPVIAPYLNPDNTSIGYFFQPQGNDTLTLKGLYFLGTRPDGLVNTGRFVNPSGDYNVFFFDHCVLENISGSGTPNLFDTWGHSHCSFYVTNCEFRNNQDDNPQNPGFAWIEVSTTDIPCDTAYFRNNTFFFTGGYVLGGAGYGCSWLDFQHNTVFMSSGGGIFDLYQMHHAIIANNIFYSASAPSAPNSWNIVGGGWDSGLIILDSLSTLKSSPYNMAESDRHLTITNNAYFWPQQFYTEWTKLNLHVPQFIGAQPGILTDKTTWPNITVANNDSVDPGFNSTLVATSIANMITMADTCWGGTVSGVAGGYRPYVYPLSDPPSNNSTWPNVASNWASTQGYPVPENLRYSNTTLKTAGTDGKALGDLNWFPEQITGVSRTPNSLPGKFALSQNYPNPFNPSTMISYTLAVKGMTRLSVFDILGREVAVLVNEVQIAGSHDVTFTAKNLSSGIYFCKLVSSETMTTMKMILMK